jgi:glycosyltransferase 2 family protein
MKKLILYSLQFLCTVALFYFIVNKYQFTWSELNIAFIEPVWLILSIYISAVFIPIIAASRWNVFLNLIGYQIPLITLIKINFESIFWGTLLPSSDGFAVIRLYKIERKYSDFPGKAGSSVIAEKLLGFFILCLFALIFSFTLKTIPNFFLIRLIILLFILLIALLTLVIFKESFYNSLLKLLLKTKINVKVSVFISNIHDTLFKLPKLPMLSSAIPLIIIVQLCTFINVFLLFKVVGIDIPFIYHLALMPVIQIISLLPLTLSGLGIREGAFVYFYGFLGVPPEVAFSISILNFLILNGIPAFIGGILSLISQLKLKEAVV